MFAYRALNWRKPATREQFLKKKKQTYLKNEEFCWIKNKGKSAKNEWENDDSDFLQALYSVHKKLGQLFSILTR